MAGTARQFAIDIDDEFHQVVELGLVRVLQMIAIETDERIKTKTPVDTGAARASWNVSVGQPVYAVKGTTMAVMSLTQPDVVWITNAMDYISALENGHSKQAPSGMVALSIAEIEAKFRLVE